jgi:hypothetical protein
MLKLIISSYTAAPFTSLGIPQRSTVDMADLIERAQFALNAKIYRPGEFEELEKLGFEGSWLQWFLFEIECFHGECSLRFLFVIEDVIIQRYGRVKGELI